MKKYFVIGSIRKEKKQCSYRSGADPRKWGHLKLLVNDLFILVGGQKIHYSILNLDG